MLVPHHVSQTYKMCPNFVMNPTYADISYHKTQAQGCIMTRQHVHSKEVSILECYFYECKCVYILPFVMRALNKVREVSALRMQEFILEVSR
jgi:hypothetical protein